MPDTRSKVDPEEERLQRLLKSARNVEGQMRSALEAAARRDVDIAKIDKDHAESSLARHDLPDRKAMERDALVQDAAMFRERAAAHRQRADTLHQQVIDGYNVRPDIRPPNAPAPTMAEQLRADMVREQVKAREEHERDRREGRIRGDDEGRER